MFGKIEGQRLNLAKMYIANYCIALADQAGRLDVYHVVKNINRDFGLVPDSQADALAQDVEYFYNCLVNQSISAIDRGSYWKWKAMNAYEALEELSKELSSLVG